MKKYKIVPAFSMRQTSQHCSYSRRMIPIFEIYNSLTLKVKYQIADGELAMSILSELMRQQEAENAHDEPENVAYAFDLGVKFGKAGAIGRNPFIKWVSPQSHASFERGLQSTQKVKA